MIFRRTMIAALAGLPLIGWSTHSDAANKLDVVASFSILGDMVQEIGGDHVVVSTLVGPNGDAHVYEPTPGDAKTLSAAKLLIVNGLDFETWMPRLFDASGFKGATVVASKGVSPRLFDEDRDEEVDPAEGASDGHAHGHLDPHAWQNLANGMIYVRNIEAGLARADPDHAADYHQAAAVYIEQLDKLNDQVKARFTKIPRDQRKIVTSHDAFGYFGDAYGLTLIAPVGMSTEAEASAADVAKIIDQIKRDDIHAVFVENISNTKLMDQIARETGAAVGGELFSDALSPPDGPAPTYVKMFEWNADQLTQALTGS